MRFNAERILQVFGFIIKPLDSVLTYLFVKRNKIRREIANNILVSPEWTKITPMPSMEIKKNLQAVLIHIEGCWRNFHEKNFRLSDGTIIKPEVEIIDEYGNEYHLRSGRSGISPLSPDSEKWIVDYIGFYGQTPKDRNYAQIRIRSDKPFQCSISWYDYNLK